MVKLQEDGKGNMSYIRSDQPETVVWEKPAFIPAGMCLQCCRLWGQGQERSAITNTDEVAHPAKPPGHHS